MHTYIPTEAEARVSEEVDELDAYMNSIKAGAMDTKTRMRLKGELLKAKAEEQRLRRLVNIARPASLPPLQPRLAIRNEIFTFTSHLSSFVLSLYIYISLSISLPHTLKLLITASLPIFQSCTRKVPPSPNCG